MSADKLNGKSKRGFWGTLLMYVVVLAAVLVGTLFASLANELLKELMSRG